MALQVGPCPSQGMAAASWSLHASASEPQTTGSSLESCILSQLKGILKAWEIS